MLLSYTTLKHPPGVDVTVKVDMISNSGIKYGWVSPQCMYTLCMQSL